MMNVTLGIPTDTREHVPLKAKGEHSPLDRDVEAAVFEVDSPQHRQDQLLALAPAISVLQVTIRKPFTIPSMLAITWSLFPYVVPVLSILSLIRHSAVGISHGLAITAGYSGFLMFYAILAIFCVFLNEKVLKRIIQEPRPTASASKSYGMPSGHATSCYAWMVWCIVEILAHPSNSGGFNFFLVWMCMFVLGPVPYARVYLLDHTGRQVFAGMVVGSVIGLLAVPIRAVMFPNAVPLWLPMT